jgi:predicted nucleic acid-binding protein
VCAALSAAGRNRLLNRRYLASAERAWERFWAATRPVELTDAVGHQAGSLAHEHGLRGADAVHLASALAIGDPDVVVAVWDQQLAAGAQAERLRVAPSHRPA